MIRQTKDMTRTAAESLDETRRLLYMALLCSRTERYELAGTLVNALAHHCPDREDPEWSRELIADRVIGVIEDANEADPAWLNRQIQRLTEALDGSKP
jgi:hypothetical protein